MAVRVIVVSVWVGGNTCIDSLPEYAVSCQLGNDGLKKICDC